MKIGRKKIVTTGVCTICYASLGQETITMLVAA